MLTKKPYTFHIDASQLAQLRLIATVSRGRPKVSALIREAIDGYVAAAKKDPQIGEVLRRATGKPRLTIAVSQYSKNDRSKS